MHKDAQRRYRTVEGLRRDIAHFLGNEPLEARPEAAIDHVRKFLRRNWQPVSLAGAILVAVVTLVTFYTARLASARDTAVAEAVRTQRIQHFLMDLFAGGDEAAGPADTLRVVTLVHRGVQEAAVLDGEPDVQAELYHTLGTVYQQLGKFDRADSLLTLALERRQAMPRGNGREVAEGLVALGMLRLQRADIEEAERLVRHGLEHSRQSLPTDHPVVLDAMTALGTVLQERGEYDAAIVMLDSVARLRAPAGRPTPELSKTLSELANTHFYAGNLTASDSLNRLALGLDSALYGERHPHVADGLINIGAIQFQLGEYAEAERYYRAALEIKEPYYGPDHYQTAANLTMLGRSLVHQGESRQTEAKQALERALAIQERFYGPVHPRVASTLNDLGNVALLRADFDAAETAFARMAETYVTIYAGKHYLIGIALSNLASVYMQRGDLARADSLFRDVVRRFTETLSAKHLNTGVARIKLGHTLALMDRFVEAEPELLAGYQIVSAQSSPTVSWLQSARRDLIRVYEVLGRAEEAERFRMELEQHQAAGGTTN
jgi:serine/threonine-protein kinase